MPPPLRRRTLAQLALAFVVAACAALPAVRQAEPRAAGWTSHTLLEVDERRYDVHWSWPAGEATALMLLEHGFSRSCDRLDGTARRLSDAGLAVLCIDAPMAAGNPALADALADRLASDALKAPDGRLLPRRIVVGGHSAGAVFAARVGARLDAAVPQRLAGALLFDPVATSRFEADLRAVSKGGARPVLALFANPHGCNANGNAWPVLQRLHVDALDGGREGFVGVRLVDGSTHADVEGDDTDWLACVACGTPRAENVERVRELAARWATDLARGVVPVAAASASWRIVE